MVAKSPPWMDQVLVLITVQVVIRLVNGQIMVPKLPIIRLEILLDVKAKLAMFMAIWNLVILFLRGGHLFLSSHF